MSVDQMRPFPMGKYLLQFMGISIAIAVAVIAFTMITGIDTPSSMGIISLVATLAAVSQSVAKNEGRELTKGERVRFATWSSLLSLALSVAMFLIMMALAGVPLNSAGIAAAFGETDIPMGILLALLAFGFVVTWVITYFAMGFTVRQALKRQAKQAQSAAKQ